MPLLGSAKSMPELTRKGLSDFARAINQRLETVAGRLQ